jgi:hypothetical protein
MAAKQRSVRRIDEVALELCGNSFVWYGNPQLCHDIYDQSGHTKATHPLNVFAAVVGAVAKSDKWRREGFITHLGRRYPVYAPLSRKPSTLE